MREKCLDIFPQHGYLSTIEGERRKMHLSKKHLAIVALTVILVVTNIAFAVLYMTKSVNISGGVIEAVGAIEVYDSDGVSPLASCDFPLFTAGGTWTGFTKNFFINNTGSQPVYVYWNISSSSIVWKPWMDVGYYHSEGTVEIKYSFKIFSSWTPDPIHEWTPNDGTTPEALYLGVDAGKQLQISLGYSGNPATAETFTLVMSFYAQDA